MQLIDNKAVCREFRDYFEKLFTRDPGLSCATFDTYLADFSRLTAMETAGCERRKTEEEVQQVLKTVGADKSPRIDGLLYKVYLRRLHMFVPLLATIYKIG